MDIFDYIEVGLVLFCAACLVATSLVEPTLWVIQTKTETWVKNHLNARDEAAEALEATTMDAWNAAVPVSTPLSVVEAYPGYLKHLRRLGPDEHPAYGGLSSRPTTLCGITIAMGWDTKISAEAFIEATDEAWGTGDRCEACQDAHARHAETQEEEEEGA